jgi:hypothetical protein
LLFSQSLSVAGSQLGLSIMKKRPLLRFFKYICTHLLTKNDQECRTWAFVSLTVGSLDCHSKKPTCSSYLYVSRRFRKIVSVYGLRI